MVVRRIALKNFRSWQRSNFELGSGLTVLAGPNGSGKTNLLEAIYFGCTGRSCRTSTDRQVVRNGAEAAHVELVVEAADGEHRLSVGLQPGSAKLSQVDGAAVETLTASELRPLVTVFLPDRLALVSGAPAGRRAHIDQLVAALRPTRAPLRSEYSRALIQRNALLSNIRRGTSSSASLDAWDNELATIAEQLTEARDDAVAAVQTVAADVAEELGLLGTLDISYRYSKAANRDQYIAELQEKRTADIERGFTIAGPHRDELRIKRDGRELKIAGSQGEKRIALLSLLLAERQVIGSARGSTPLLLLDDVMSELDAERRALLVRRISESGQCVVTATEFEHVPATDGTSVVRIPIGPESNSQRLKIA